MVKSGYRHDIGFIRYVNILKNVPIFKIDYLYLLFGLLPGVVVEL